MLQSKKRDFYKELMTFAIPIGLQNLLVALIGASDALMLGRLTQDAIAAVSLANQIAFVMSLFTGAVIGGGGILIAQYFGKGDNRTVNKLFCSIIRYAFTISLIFFLLAFFLPDKLMGIYTDEAELIRIGSSYLKIVSFSYLFNGITQCYFLMMKITGKAAHSVIISLVTVIADMIIDFFLIYGKAGAPALGADGSAYSTIFVEAIALIWCIIASYQKGGIHPSLAGSFHLSKGLTYSLIKVTLPMLSSSLTWGLGFSMHSLIMGHLGTDAAAAASVVSVAQELITCLCKGVSAGAGIILGKELGKNMLDRAKEYGKEFCHCSFRVGLINALLLCIVGPAVTAFFVLSDTAKHYLIIMLLFSAFYLFAYSLNTIIVCGIFPAGGDSRYDAISVLISMWCFAIPLAFLGTFVFHWPIMLVYILLCSDEIIKLPWLIPRYKKYIWLKNLTQDEAC